jgi:hypothetical protein
VFPPGRAVRVDADSIAVRVKASPAGALRRPVIALLADVEARRTRDSFRFDQTLRSNGRASMSPQEAIELGRTLARALLPPPVFRLLAESVASVARSPRRGLRLRLDLDSTLIDLPWEYLYRPDLTPLRY